MKNNATIIAMKNHLSPLLRVSASLGGILLLSTTFLIAADSAKPSSQEGSIAPFLKEAYLDSQIIFDGDDKVREPYFGIAVDGTLLAMRNYLHILRRSEDGGTTWGEEMEVGPGFLDSNFIVDERSGDILSLSLAKGEDWLWRSRDKGLTWEKESIQIQANEVMKWLDRTGLKKRGSSEDKDEQGIYFLHNNASESGITLRHSDYRGRLLVTGTFRPIAKEHPSDRKPIDEIYACAMYSDDGGKTWRVSGLFPAPTTEESCVVELSDGTLYFNSRCGDGFYGKSLARELRPEEIRRREAWSRDGGETWEDLRINQTLVDGGGYDRGYGLKAGLVRLPIDGRDILIYTNTDTAGGTREKLTVWASFDGGQTWPIKRLLNEGHSAYSSLLAGRPGTSGEGTIFLLYEGGREKVYQNMHFARFNLSWVLGGELTGDGSLPDWLPTGK